MDKKSFVEKQLQRLVKAVDPSIQQLIYKTSLVNEVVEICYITGRKTVDVTTDSLKAIAVDVLKRI